MISTLASGSSPESISIFATIQNFCASSPASVLVSVCFNSMDSLARDLGNVLRIPDEMEKMLRPSERAYVKNAKAMFRTPADIYEHTDSYHFLLDMPGLEIDKIKVLSNLDFNVISSSILKISLNQLLFS